jgi:hypothetical protein
MYVCICKTGLGYIGIGKGRFGCGYLDLTRAGV